MAEPAFEQRLVRLFADAPSAPDAPLFAHRLEARLDRAWTARRLTIGVAAFGSASAAVWQFAASAGVARLEEAARAPLMLIDKRLRLAEAAANLLHALPLAGEAVWLLGGLVLLAAGLAATRLVDEI